MEKEKIVEIFGVDNFQEMDIRNVVEKLKYPNLLFGIEDDKITVSVDYRISKDYSDEILCIKMDDKLNITGFSHES